MKKILHALLLFVILLSYSCKKEEDSRPIQDLTLTITSFEPASGDPGTSVIVYCQTSRNEIASQVLFNNTPADIIEATPSRISVNVPAGASTGKITVTVGNTSATSEAVFTVTSTPVITSFEPQEGITGTTVTIHGNNFSTTPTDNNVVFSVNRKATVLTASVTELTVTVPAESLTGRISVTVNNKWKISDTDFTVLPVPIITKTLPEVGAIGTAVIINGSNFSTTPANNIVKFGNVEATVLSATSSSLHTKVPAGAVTAKVTVIVNELPASSPVDFLITELPAITSLTPSKGAPGTSVTITGSGFASLVGSTMVTLTSVGTITNNSPTELTFVVPSESKTGKITILTNVKNGTFLSIVSANNFIVPAPIVSSIPSSASTGEEITITGDNFSTISASDNHVKIGTSEAEVTGFTQTTLTLKVPAAATTGKISVRVGDLTTESSTTLTIL